ncbi:MAG: DUF1876 family protein [Actinobacteria bacterium]|nr:DUF1876 family protein [Actinomycetota bacterium]
MSAVKQSLLATVSIEEDELVTTALCILEVKGEKFIGEGKAKRNPEDQNLPLIGDELALSRAFSDLSQQIAQSANEKINEYLKE